MTLPYRMIPATPSTGKWTGPWAVHLIGPRGGNNVYLGRVTRYLDGWTAEIAVTIDSPWGMKTEHGFFSRELYKTREAGAEAIWQAWRKA